MKKVWPINFIIGFLSTAIYPALADTEDDINRLKSVAAVQQVHLDTQGERLKQAEAKIAAQATTITQLQTTLQSVSNKLASILTADGQIRATGGKVVVNQAGKWVGDASGLKGDAGTNGSNGKDGKNGKDGINGKDAKNNLFLANTGGNKSCQNHCYSLSGSCIVAFAGANPNETWTCDKKPEGNLTCVCYKG